MTPERMKILELVYHGTMTTPEEGILISEVIAKSQFKRNEAVFIINYLIDKGFMRIVGDKLDSLRIRSEGVDFYEFNTRVQ